MRRAAAAALIVVASLAFAGCGAGNAQPSAGVERIVGELGRGPGQFFYPRSVAVDPSGRLAAVDRSGRIQLFGPSGEFLLAFEPPETMAGQSTGINFSRGGRLLVADSHYHRILVYRLPDTAPLPGGAAGPVLERAIGSDGAGDGQFTLVRDVVEDSRGFLHAGDYDGPVDRVLTFTANGTFVRAFGRRGSGDGEFRRPQGMTVFTGPEGEESLLVADCCNHRIQRFSLDGRFLAAFGRLGEGPGEMKYPYGVAVLPRDAPGGPGILVVEWGNNRIQRFDADGRSRGTWGRPGREAGGLSTPWDAAAAPDGRVFIADFGNHRIQVVRPGAIGG